MVFPFHFVNRIEQTEGVFDRKGVINLLAYLVIGYLVLGILSIFIWAYDIINNSFDFGMSNGWEFFWYQRYIIWGLILLLAPVYFVLGMYNLISDIPNAIQWKKTKSFTRKLK